MRTRGPRRSHLEVLGRRDWPGSAEKARTQGQPCGSTASLLWTLTVGSINVGGSRTAGKGPFRAPRRAPWGPKRGPLGAQKCSFLHPTFIDPTLPTARLTEVRADFLDRRWTPLPMARGARQGRRWRRRRGGPAPIQEIRVDLRKSVFIALFLLLFKAF